MKTNFILFVITLALFSCRSNPPEDKHTLVAGKGFGQIEIEKTTLTEIIKLCGNNFSVDTFYTPVFALNRLTFDSVDKKRIYSIEFSFDSLGLSFFFRPNKHTPFSIIIHSPFIGSTDKGILLNKSTFNDVVKKYGETSWSFSDNRIIKSYSGISFQDEVHIEPTIGESESKKYLNNKITEIVIRK